MQLTTKIPNMCVTSINLILVYSCQNLLLGADCELNSEGKLIILVWVAKNWKSSSITGAADSRLYTEYICNWKSTVLLSSITMLEAEYESSDEWNTWRRILTLPDAMSTLLINFVISIYTKRKKKKSAHWFSSEIVRNISRNWTGHHKYSNKNTTDFFN